jgi:hypothetical protein
VAADANPVAVIDSTVGNAIAFSVMGKGIS